MGVQVRKEGTYQLQMVLQTLNPQGAWQQDRTLAATLGPDGQQQVSVQFNDVAEGRVYKLSLGVFDANWHLVKWFDQVSLVQLQSGAVQVPQLVTENPCQSREVTGAGQ
jgi:hypothetical protein